MASDRPVVAEQADLADLDSLRAIGSRHMITGIVHLAGYPAPRGSIGGVDATRGLLDGLLNIVRVAQDWGVARIGRASTGVYAGLTHQGPLTEDLPVRLSAPHPIPRSKKIGELLGEQLAEAVSRPESGPSWARAEICMEYAPYEASEGAEVGMSCRR